jgi:hypothetical protein
MVQVIVPRTAEQLDDVRDLMRAFVAWHRQRHQQDLALIDLRHIWRSVDMSFPSAGLRSMDEFLERAE